MPADQIEVLIISPALPLSLDMKGIESTFYTTNHHHRLDHQRLQRPQHLQPDLNNKQKYIG